MYDASTNQLVPIESEKANLLHNEPGVKLFSYKELIKIKGLVFEIQRIKPKSLKLRLLDTEENFILRQP